MIKRFAILLLITTLILSSIPINVVNASSLTKFATDEEFYAHVELTLGKPYIKDKNQRFYANRETFNEYQQIVYGGQHGDKKKGITPWVKPGYEHLLGKMLPRYIGYDWNGGSVGNTHFTPDATSGTDPSKFNYIPNSSNIALWDALHPDVMNHMLNAPLWGNGATSPFKTLNQLGGKAYGKPVSLSSWLIEGSIHMIHNNGKNYVTQNVSSMLGSASGIVIGQITTPTDTYYIRKGETQVNIPVTVKANAELKGYAKATHIEEITASFQGKLDRKKGVSEALTTQDFIATRSNYNVGTHNITLEGNVSLRTIFNDTGSRVVRKTITLIVEPEGEDPYVTTTVTPDPNEKKFENKDIDVVLTVNGELHNYTKTSNIKEWVFYAREKEASSADVKKVYSKTLNANTTFKFKIPASKVTEDTFKQYYVVRAEVVFNEKVQGATKVNGGWAISAPAEAVVVVYKDKPPTEPKPPKPSPSNPPTTKIYGQTVVPAGEPTRYSARASAAPGKRIEYAEFYSSVPPYKETDSKISYSFTKTFTMDDIGPDRLIEHIVEDNEGATASDFLLVEVTPPKPNASLKFDGWLKEKRVVEVIDTSTSYGIPINDSRTRITITPEGDGATNNIRYLRTYKDIYDRSVREYVFSDGGTYNVEIYVENTSGISDTKTYNIVIEPDIPPIAEYSFSNKIYRDKNNNNFAKMEIIDLSYSADYDKIVERTWTITYNANNNKDVDGFPNYADDTSFQIKDSELEIFKEKILVKNGFTYKITKIASDIITIQVNQVGNYLIELKVTEGYGMEGNTSHKHKTEKTITVLNREPFVDFEP